MRLGVVGIGNVMFGDEGVGVHLAKLIEKNYKFSSPNGDEIEFVDGGTLAIALTPILASFDRLVVIDCIDAADASPGDVFFFDYDKMPLNVRWDGSAHEVEMLQTLQLMQLAGDMPPTHILGIVPTRVEPMTFELSDALQKGASVGESALIKFIKSLGFEAQKVASYSLCDMANEYAKRGL